MTQVENLNLYFVLPFENAEEEDCSDVMRLAIEAVLKYDGKARCVKPSFCMDHVPEKNDVFIFDKFEGPSFEKIKEQSAKILGARCMLTCITNGRSIPPGVSPVMTEGMRGLFVCSSGFDSSMKKFIQEKVQFMGGIYDKSLRSATTHIVAHNNITSKATEGFKHKIPIMKLEWIEAVWTKSLELNVNGKDDVFKQYLSPLFNNLKITTSGIAKREKDKIKELIENNGGTFMGCMEEKTTNIVILNKPEGEKYKYAQAWNITCLHPDWIYESIKAKAVLQLSNFTVVSKKPKASTPKKDEVNLTANFAMISNIGFDIDEKFTHLEETAYTLTNASIQSQFQIPRPLSQTDNKPAYANIIDNLLFKNAKEAGQFLDGCNVYLTGFNPEYAEKLRKVLNMGGATRFDELSGCVTHIIAGNVSQSNLASMKNVGSYILSINWLVQSMQLKRPAPESKFLLVDNVSSSSEPPSPLSKQGAKLLTKENRTIQKPTFDLEKPNETSPPEEDLLCKYNDSQPGEPLMQPEVASVASNVSNVTKSSSVLDNEYIFKDLVFYISSELEEAKQVEDVIVERGGQVVGKRFSGVPDYAVVPVIGASLTEITSKEVVNIFFIKDCCLQSSIVAIQYYHQPVAYVKDSSPLKNCVITLSNYTECDREFIEYLIDKLGAIGQPLLARKPKENIYKSTHLICAEPTGPKYNGAVRWGLPVVNHNWLLKCASVGYRVSERPYLVGDSKLSSQPSINQTQSSNSQANSTLAGTSKAVAPPQTLAHKNSPVHNAITRLKKMETPKASNSPDANRTITPTSPYGAFYGNDNPSPGTRKRLLRWMQQGADFPLDPPMNKLPEPNRRDSTPLSELLSRQLLLMKRKPEDLPPDSPVAVPPKRLYLETPEPESESQKQSLVISSGLQKMKEIEENYAKSCVKPTTPVRKSHENAPPQMLIVAESQPHTEVGWEDPTEKEVALGKLEKAVKKEYPVKLFMISCLDEDLIKETKQLIESSGGKVSPLPHFDRTATHLITGNLNRGEKLMGSIAAGLWVLHPSYVDQLRTVRDVQQITEEDYEWGNPNQTFRMHSLSTDARDYAQCSYTWRNLIRKGKQPPFKDMKIILNISESKYEPFKRLLEAGGGEIVNAKPPFSGEIGATVCICDVNNADKIDLKFLAKQKISCVTASFVSDHVLRRSKPIETYFVPGFGKYWQ